MILCLYLSLITASISYTITETKIFSSWRQWLKNRHQFLGDLFARGLLVCCDLGDLESLTRLLIAALQRIDPRFSLDRDDYIE